MSDNEDWRRRKAEERGLVNPGPWLSRPPRQSASVAGAAPHRAPDESAVRAPTQGSADDQTSTSIRTQSGIPDDAIYVDRRRRVRPGAPPEQPAASPAATSTGSALHRWSARGTTMLAIVAGLVLALVLGWWLRGATAPADVPYMVPTTAAPSSGSAVPAAGSEPGLSDGLAAADGEPGPTADNTPEPALARIPSATRLPTAEYAPATVPTPLAESPPAASSPRDQGSPAAAQYRTEGRARAPVATDEALASRPDRLGEPRARLSAPRGRFTAPRAVAALGRDFSPSFNCRRATSWVNRKVCSNKELAVLDVRMSDTYGGAIAAAGPAGERRIDIDQARFLGQRALCRTAACIDRAYRIRIDELNSIN